MPLSGARDGHAPTQGNSLAASVNRTTLVSHAPTTASAHDGILPSTRTSGLEGPSGFLQDGSHGTLLLDKEGRARYLGPTAGSEWLKDV